MAYQTLVAANWLVSKKSELEVKFHEFKWGTGYGIPLFDFEISILGGHHSGRGSSTDQNLAFEKAAAEALERFVCFENGISTEGVAAHSIAELADHNAGREAIERYLFHWHLNTKTPFISDIALSNTQKIAQAVAARGGTISWMKMRPAWAYESSLCLIEKNDRKFLGIGLGDSADETQLHAAIEALRNFAAYCENKEPFLKAAETNPDLWCCSHSFFESHRTVFEKPDTVSSAAIAPMNFPVHRQTLASRSITDIPLTFVRATIPGSGL